MSETYKRVNLDIESDLWAEIKELCHRNGCSSKWWVNQALRASAIKQSGPISIISKGNTRDTKDNTNNTKNPDEYSEEFESFWKETIKKGPKKQAWWKWQERLKEGFNPAQITQAYARMASEKKDSHISYWPQIVNFLGCHFEGYWHRQTNDIPIEPRAPETMYQRATRKLAEKRVKA